MLLIDNVPWIHGYCFTDEWLTIRNDDVSYCVTFIYKFQFDCLVQICRHTGRKLNLYLE